MEKLKELNDLFSKQRMQEYVRYNSRAPFDSYKNNIEQSVEFYKIISYFEVILRNKLDRVLTKKYGDWYLTNSDFYKIVLKGKQKDAIDSLLSKQYINNTDKNQIISELTLGFWVALFSRKYEQTIWKDKSIYNMMGMVSLAKTARDLETIRRFRNRIFYQEKILNYHPSAKYDLIYKYLLLMIPKGYKIKEKL